MGLVWYSRSEILFVCPASFAVALAPCSRDVTRADFALQAIWQASPMAPFHDPRTVSLRHGMRWNRFETNTRFKMVHKDLNHCLLKACVRGLSDFVPGLVDKGADINFLGQAKTGLSADLVGFTPISAAAHQGWPAVVRMLLDLGADQRGGVMDDPQYAAGHMQCLVSLLHTRPCAFLLCRRL